MKFELRWSDVQHTTEAGTHPFRTGTITFQSRHIAAWEEDPGGIWEVYGVIAGRRRSTRYVLRRFRASKTPRTGSEGAPPRTSGFATPRGRL